MCVCVTLCASCSKATSCSTMARARRIRRTLVNRKRRGGFGGNLFSAVNALIKPVLSIFGGSANSTGRLRQYGGRVAKKRVPSRIKLRLKKRLKKRGGFAFMPLLATAARFARPLFGAVVKKVLPTVASGLASAGLKKILSKKVRGHFFYKIECVCKYGMSW